MAPVLIIGRMLVIIRVTGSKIRYKERAPTNGQMAVVLKAAGKITTWMAMEYTLGKTADVMKVNT